MERTLETIERYLIYLTVFLFPITVLSISPNPFVVSKLAVLSYGVSLILLVKAVRMVVAGKLNFSVSKFDFPVLLFGGAYLASAILRTPNKMEAFLLPGTATAVIGGVLLYFLINQLNEQSKNTLSSYLFASGTFFSVLILLAFSGIFDKIPQLPAYIRAQGFTPEGGYMPSAIFLAILLPIGVGLLLSEKDVAKKALWAVAGVVILLGLSISIYNLLPGQDFTPRLQSYSTSWSVSVDALKESPVLGIGPANYLSAFNRFRPIEYNTTDLWPVKFATARSFYLTILTEAGLLGAAAVILLLFTLYKDARRRFDRSKVGRIGVKESTTLLSLLLLVVLFIFIPATNLLIVALPILLALNTSSFPTSLELTTRSQGEEMGKKAGLASRFPAFLIAIPIVIVVILFGFNATQVLRAEHRFKKAVDSLVRNDAAATYDTMREAIRLNPRVDRYHTTFARVNLAIANSIAQNEEITDADRQTITQLVQQAINEAKATVALNPLRAGNWEVLGQTYRAIMSLAQGADQFAIQSYRQAIALDPINPNLRISLGGIHYALGNFDQAIRVFELASAYKPDLANAHYNLAFALREAGEIDRAIQEMTVVLSLLERGTPDHEAASQALQDLQERRAAQAPQGEELTPPEEAEEPALEPPLDLPEGAEPPESPVSPTPTPEEGEEEPSPTPTP